MLPYIEKLIYHSSALLTVYIHPTSYDSRGSTQIILADHFTSPVFKLHNYYSWVQCQVTLSTVYVYIIIYQTALKQICLLPLRKCWVTSYCYKYCIIYITHWPAKILSACAHDKSYFMHTGNITRHGSIALMPVALTCLDNLWMRKIIQYCTNQGYKLHEGWGQ